MIHLVRQEDIDRQRWDNCVKVSPTKLPYAHSWYLDIIAPRWQGLIMDDYKAVMPLPTKQKAGIIYSFQPPFAQQLGIWSQHRLQADDVQCFLEALPDSYRVVDLHLHYQTPKISGSKVFWEQRENYTLPLQQSYEEIHSNYSSNRKRDCKKARKNQLQTTDVLSAEELIRTYQRHIGVGLDSQNEALMRRLIEEAGQRGTGFLHAIRNKQGNLEAASFFIDHSNRLINLLTVTTAQGRKSGAGTLLYDSLIKQYAEQNKTLDFEGSTIPSISKFYASFGALSEPYWRIRRNLLIWPVKVIEGVYRLFKQ